MARRKAEPTGETDVERNRRRGAEQHAEHLKRLNDSAARRAAEAQEKAK